MEKLDVKFKTSDLLFVSYQIGYATYNFEKAMVSRIASDGRTLVCLYPRVMFYSEKGAERRISPAGNLRVEIPLPHPFASKLRGRITDISPNGMSFIAEEGAPTLLKGRLSKPSRSSTAAGFSGKRRAKSATSSAPRPGKARD